MRHHGIWHSAYGVCAWSRTAGPGGAGAGSVDGGIPRCGYFVLARDTGDFRVARVLNAGRAMDCFGVPLLDQYLMREMMPVLVLAIGLCATLGMSLGALAGLVREVAISGMS